MQSGTHEVWSRPPKTRDEGLVPPILGFRFGNKFLGILCPISWSKHTYYGIWLYLRNHFQSRNLLHHPFHKMYTMGIKTTPMLFPFGTVVVVVISPFFIYTWNPAPVTFLRCLTSGQGPWKELLPVCTCTFCLMAWSSRGLEAIDGRVGLSNTFGAGGLRGETKIIG